MSKTNSRHPSMALGGVFLSLFGAVWLFIGTYRYAGANLPALSIIAVVSILIATWAVMTFRARRAAYTGANSSATRKGLIIVNILQWAAISFMVLLLNLTHHVDLIMPCAIFIVGAHFLPLAKILRYRGYYLTGTGLVLVALLYMLFRGEDQSVVLALLSTGAILWTSAIALLAAV